jgi:hypothetical protein
MLDSLEKSIRALLSETVEVAAVFRDLEEAFQSGRLDEWQHDLNLHMIWCYHLYGLAGD